MLNVGSFLKIDGELIVSSNVFRVEKLRKGKRYCTSHCGCIASQPAGQSHLRNPLIHSHTDHCSKDSRRLQQLWQRKPGPQRYFTLLFFLPNESGWWSIVTYDGECVGGGIISETAHIQWTSFAIFWTRHMSGHESQRVYAVSIHDYCVSRIINDLQRCLLLHAEAEKMRCCWVWFQIYFPLVIMVIQALTTKNHLSSRNPCLT